MPYVFNPFTGNFDYTASASTGGTVNALPLSGGNLTGLVTNTNGISASYFRSKQGIPDSADSSTNGYTFAGDGDTGLFSPIIGGGDGNGVVAIYTNNVEQARFVNNNVGFGTQTPNTKVTVVGSVSASNTVYDRVGNSNNWNSAYDTSTAYQNASGSFATNTFVNTNFFKVSGGTITGATRINGNLTVLGDVSATGVSYFQNTVYSTTSALSVINTGNTGPAIYVGNNGTGDIASFYDLDAGVEVLHVGGNNGTFPNVGVKTSYPNKTLTVSGEVSATSDITTSGKIYIQGGGNSDQWGNAYTTVQNNSATTWNYQGTDLKNLSAGWVGGNNAYSNLVSNSAAYLSATNLSFLSVSGNWSSAYSSVTALSANWILDSGNTKSSNLTIGTNDAFNVNLESNNTVRLTVLSSGNVGIGTTVPNQILTVVGNISASTAIITPRVSADVISGDSGETIFTDGINLGGSGPNTLTMNYLSGVYIRQPRVNIESRLYMYSPNGTRYYLNITNTGVLTATIG